MHFSTAESRVPKAQLFVTDAFFEAETLTAPTPRRRLRPLDQNLPVGSTLRRFARVILLLDQEVVSFQNVRRHPSV
jgi:hypothetical protein